MQHIFIEYVFLIMAILALVMIANKVRLPFPIILVIGGLALSFFSALSDISINPEMFFFIFLPPLLYESAWQISWKEFWKWRRIIAIFAFPMVIVTATVVAFISNALIPGFTLALGFLLGGIVSPPDAISATTIMKKVKVPKSLVSIAAGESLLNDASSLIIFRFAVIAVITGQFHFKDASINFFLVIVMGILIGLAVGLIFYAIHRWLPVTPSIEIILTFVTPYFMYYAAEYFHFSGVLAVVTGGLFLSNRRQSMLDYRSRIRGVNVWSSIVFVMNGLVFLLIGLQLPAIIRQLGNTSLVTATWYGIAISVTLILTRMASTLGASVLTRFVGRYITVNDPNPGWKAPVILGWSGMRGAVSLAAALSIPLIINGEQPFPYRSLILFITFIVILITLVLQGLTLPWLVRKLDIQDKPNEKSLEEQEKLIQKKLLQYSIQHLEQKYSEAGEQNEHLKILKSKLTLELDHFSSDIKEKEGSPLQEHLDIYLELLEQQRKILNLINDHSEFDEELIRKYLSLIDFEELHTRTRTI